MQFQKWPKIKFLELGTIFKTAKNAISQKNFFLIYLISQVFLPELILNFLARCAITPALSTYNKKLILYAEIEKRLLLASFLEDPS